MRTASWLVAALAAITVLAPSSLAATTNATVAPTLATNTTKVPTTTKTPTTGSGSSDGALATVRVPTESTDTLPSKSETTTAPKSSTSSLIQFKSIDGAIYADDKPFYIKGVNWFGFETIEAVVQGIWPYGTTVEAALDLLVDYEINALRLPLAIDSILNDQEVSADQTAGVPSLAGKSYLEVLDYIISECRKRNILVVLVNHRMAASEPDFPDIAEPSKIIPAMKALATRYCDNPSTWNVMGVDIKNQPKGKATWGAGDSATDWNLQAAEIGNAVLDKCARWLVFVEGVQTNIQGETLAWGQSGGSLQGAKKNPVKLKNMERLVYSPHLISPGVDFKAPWWVDTSFPSNMVKIWDAYFGFVPKTTGNAVVVSAWGAKMEGNNKKWATAVSSYLSENSIGSFYWAFNPQSADTGGLVLDDWKTPIAERFDLLSSLPSTSVAGLLKKYSQCTNKCNGSGECVAGVCKCFAGWTGPQCDVCTPGDPGACNNAGTCQKDSTCACDAGVKGDYCNGLSCDGISCGSGKYAGCTNGQCLCSFNCIGGDCTQCAANSSMLSTDVTTLCDTCPAPDKEASTSPASTTPMAAVASLVAAVSAAMLISL